MNINRFWCAVALIALTSCVQKEDMPEGQEDICPFMIELDTLNALDVGFIYVKNDDMMEEYDEAGIIYYKKTESSSQNEIALYMKGSDDSSGECRTTIRVEPESEYAWRPYTITGDVRKLYKISTFKVGKSFSAAYLSCEKGAVQLDITVPFPTEVSYMCVKKSQEEITREVLWANGKHRTFMKEGRYYVSAQLDENAHYQMYLIAKEGMVDYTDVFVYEFDTGEFLEEDLLNLMDVGYDGFTMKLSMPLSVKTTDYGAPDSRAIRYIFGNLLMYNLKRYSGHDDYDMLLHNGSKFFREDYIFDISDENIWAKVDYDVNNDGIIDENDCDYQWDPIFPGEPVVFVAGEFEWMQLPKDWNDDELYVVNGFGYPYNWGPGYYIPCLDSERYFAGKKTKSVMEDVDLSVEMDSYWTGAFQREVFRVKEPGLLEAEMDVNIKDVSSTDATVEFVPGTGVHSYYFCVLDKTSYSSSLSLLDNNDEYLQWFVTSYYAKVKCDALNKKGKFECKLADYLGDVDPYSEYHILVTALGNEEGATQRFIHEVVYTTSHESRPPEIEVSAAPEFCIPGNAVFKIRNLDLDNPITEAYYAANYISVWEELFKSGHTYTSLTDMNVPFTSSELRYINSESGYYMTIPGESGCTMRMAVIGYNKEGRSNELISDKSSGIADCEIQ